MRIIDKNHLMELLKKHELQTYPDPKLTYKILDILGLLSIPDLGFTLNSKMKEERAAAMNMVRRFLEDLLSEDPERYREAKETLAEFYYKVDEPDILES